MIIDHIRDLDEFKKLYESRPMPRQYDFDWLVNNPNLFCFYSEGMPGEGHSGKLLGFITIQKENDELTLSGTSIRKNLDNILIALKCICANYKEDLYAYTYKKEAGYVLRKVGFVKVHNDNNGLIKWRKQYGK